MSVIASWGATIRLWWTAGFSLLLLLNLDQFGFSAGFAPAPKFWSVGAFLVTFVLFLPGLNPTRLLREPLVWWVVGYLAVSALWVGLADSLEAAGEGMVRAVTTCLFIGSALLSYPSVDFKNRLWTAVLWLALLLAVCSVLMEYFYPAAYVFSEAGQGITGRAAGFYLNPNTAAQAVIMILACVMAHGSRRANIVALLVSAIGMILTFSRGGVVAWLFLVVAASVRGRLPRWFLVVLALCAAVVSLAGPWVFDALSAWVTPENRNSLGRLAWLLGQGELNDYSSGEREYIASFAWQQFLDAPLLGHGLGYMWAWPADVGTHNLSLRFMVEFGVLGLLLFPLFLLASVRSSPPGADRTWSWLVAGIALMLSMFSHNMVEQANFLLPWLANCLMPFESARARPGSATS